MLLYVGCDVDRIADDNVIATKMMFALLDETWQHISAIPTAVLPNASANSNIGKKGCMGSTIAHTQDKMMMGMLKAA